MTNRYFLRALLALLLLFIVGTTHIGHTQSCTSLVLNPTTGKLDCVATAAGAAGGDLSGTYPNPTVAKVDGTSVPVNSAADQVLGTTASAVGAWMPVANCVAAGGVLQYATAGHTFSCHTLASADIPNNAANTSGTAANLSGTPALPNGTTTTTQSQGDASTKLSTTSYVDTAVSNAIAGVNPAVAVQAASATVLPNSPTYLNGVGGIGATLTTATTNTALVVDGYTMTLLDRVLVKNQASALQNGVYFLSTLQSLGVAWVLTRALDYDQPSDMNNTGAIPVVNGTVNAQTQWVQTSQVATVGTDAVTYTQFTIKPSTIMTTTTVLTAAQLLRYACTVSNVSSISCAHNLNTSAPGFQCWNSGGTIASVTGVTVTDANTLAFTFSSAMTGTCTIWY